MSAGDVGGRLCDSCERVIAEVEPVAFYRSGRRVETRCMSCFDVPNLTSLELTEGEVASKHESSSTFREYHPGERWICWPDYVADPCPECGRWMYLNLYFHRDLRPRREFCSARCYQRARRRQARGVVKKVCEVCGSTFHPARHYARYCSGACRQRAYRERRPLDA